MKLSKGQIIDRYVVDRVLGTGGTAIVYLVRHQRLNTLHALKVLSVSSEHIRERMLIEGKVQAALNHENVVTVTDVLDLNGSPGLLMEHIEGTSLEEALNQYQLTPRDAERLFRGILAGTRAAHAAGLVHRDLKPANVLLKRTSNGFIPKVTDFGLAKVLSQSGDINRTQAGVAMGTPSYMAPEQIKDANSVDPRADIWSLGCILYELMTRRRAFSGNSAITIYNKVLEADYVAPRRFLPRLPDRLEQAIHGCLRVDLGERIPSCDMLTAVIKGEQVWALHSSPKTMLPGMTPPMPEVPNRDLWLDLNKTTPEPVTHILPHFDPTPSIAATEAIVADHAVENEPETVPITAFEETGKKAGNRRLLIIALLLLFVLFMFLLFIGTFGAFGAFGALFLSSPNASPPAIEHVQPPSTRPVQPTPNITPPLPVQPVPVEPTRPPEPVAPEPVVPEPVVPEPIVPEPVVPEPAVPAQPRPVASPKPVAPSPKPVAPSPVPTKKAEPAPPPSPEPALTPAPLPVPVWVTFEPYPPDANIVVSGNRFRKIKAFPGQVVKVVTPSNRTLTYVVGSGASQMVCVDTNNSVLLPGRRCGALSGGRPKLGL